MSKLDDFLKGNTPIYALIGVLASGGTGINLLSEGAEDTERAELTEKIEQADYVQDVKHDALLALVNEMRIELAVLQERQED